MLSQFRSASAHRVIALSIAFATAGLPSEAGAQPRPQPEAKPRAAAPAAPQNDYGKRDAWLCRPGRKGACAVDLAATIVSADGTLAREGWSADPKPAVDCFYVYPTVSADPTPNSDMAAGAEEKSVIAAQFARFGSQCRLFAPLYRQVTLTALRAGMAGQPVQPNRELGYNDVRDAWNHYLEHDNRGRGVVLIGHSQGARVLHDLIQREIDGKPIQDRIVSAMLIGTTVAVPKGADVGGSFKHMRLCRSASQTGCVISYASFRANAPPPKETRFGRVQDGSGVAACTNPAALAGGSGALRPYLAASGTSLGASLPPPPWVKPERAIKTHFVSTPGLLSGECVQNDQGSYLAITVHGDASDPRVDDIVGDIVRDGKVQADWGLHLIDVSVAMGNLLAIVDEQSASYTATAKLPPTPERQRPGAGVRSAKQ
jgi:hypothetical protein